ncbi:MAG: Uma2 family endonuclease [Chitinophagales bacterium]
METTIDRPPRTAMEVFKFLPEGTLSEVIENQFYVHPVPNEVHQGTLSDIILEIGNYVKQQDLGIVRIVPYGVYLDDKNVVEPDILFISRENIGLIKKDGLHGTPDLIIEILSPSNERHDTVTKKNLYEKFGVKEYWIVDPENKVATGYELKKGKFQSIGITTNKIPSKLLHHTFSF